MQIDRSPLARPFPDMPPIAGVNLRVARAQYKAWDRCDLTFVELEPGTSVAGVFTKSACAPQKLNLGARR
jgi:glutamate N-acetyltransferase / amino-acid N-acetyltransferase